MNKYDDCILNGRDIIFFFFLQKRQNLKKSHNYFNLEMRSIFLNDDVDLSKKTKVA